MLFILLYLGLGGELNPITVSADLSLNLLHFLPYEIASLLTFLSLSAQKCITPISSL